MNKSNDRNKITPRWNEAQFEGDEYNKSTTQHTPRFAESKYGSLTDYGVAFANTTSSAKHNTEMRARVDFVLAACNAHAANVARIAELEAAWNDVAALRARLNELNKITLDSMTSAALKGAA